MSKIIWSKISNYFEIVSICDSRKHDVCEATCKSFFNVNDNFCGNCCTLQFVAHHMLILLEMMFYDNIHHVYICVRKNIF